MSDDYMSGWNTTRANRAADKIDHIADKADFAIDMIKNALVGFDGVEKELVALSSGLVPPQPASLAGIAARVDTYQKQIREGLDRIQKLMKDIDQVTDGIQTRSSSGWK